jgi:hypothetical protein
MQRILLLLPFLLTGFFAAAQTDQAVTVFPGVLRMAEWAKFPYEKTLAEAKKGDGRSIVKLLDFQGAVDGDDAINHAVTCLELIPVAGDDKFHDALRLTNPKVRKAFLDRLLLAQGRTKHEALRVGMSEWAPRSWNALHGKFSRPQRKQSDQPSLDKTRRPEGHDLNRQ